MQNLYWYSGSEAQADFYYDQAHALGCCESNCLPEAGRPGCSQLNLHSDADGILLEVLSC